MNERQQIRALLLATAAMCALCFWSWWNVTTAMPNNVCDTVFAKCY